jgi:hypothetical protein
VSATRHTQTGKGRAEQHQGNRLGDTSRSRWRIVRQVRDQERRGWIIAQTIHNVRWRIVAIWVATVLIVAVMGVKCRFRRTSEREPRYREAPHLLSGSVKQARQRDLGRPIIGIEVEQKPLRHGGDYESANPVPGRVLSAWPKVVDRIGGSGLAECGERKDGARSCQTSSGVIVKPILSRRPPAIYKSNDLKSNNRAGIIKQPLRRYRTKKV